MSKILYITGDFNIHVETFEDSCPAKFTNMFESFGLNQHVSVSTYESGHTLDLGLEDLQYNNNNDMD